MRIICISMCVILSILLCAMASAAVKPCALFSDGAVIQRGAIVPIWGTAEDGEKVTVKFRGQVVSTTASGGRWMVRLRPLKAGGPYTMLVNDEEITNLLVGEVWVCGGQSNMEMSLSLCENADAAIAGSADKMIRLYSVPKRIEPGELPKAWRECAPETVKTFPGVPYYFGRELRKAIKVPIGLIDTAVGASPAEAWTRLSDIQSNPELMDILDKPWTLPSYLYMSVISPLQPFAIRGVIWYQGESNALALRAYEYKALFSAMVRGWREDWKQGDFPFLCVQLAPFAGEKDPKYIDQWAELREAQLQVSQTVPRTAMVVITDYGDELDIHPKKKDPVGYRLALAAQAVAYGKDVVYSGPTFKSMRTEGSRVILNFDHVHGGLVAKDGKLIGFTIAGDDRKFISAVAEIKGRTVIVSNRNVINPMAVRYGWKNYPEVNLFNKEGLPASPFRTDNYSLTPGKL